MKLKTLFENVNSGTVAGYSINGMNVEPDMKIWVGNFGCRYRNLTSLKGCPEEIKRIF